MWKLLPSWIQEVKKKTFLWKAPLVLGALWRKHSVFCKKMHEKKIEQKQKVFALKVFDTKI